MIAASAAEYSEVVSTASESIEPTAVPFADVEAVVVAVDGSPTADRALEWAARYASLEGRPLLSAHALGTIGMPESAGLTPDSGPMFAAVYEQLYAEGEQVVEAAVQKVAAAYPDLVTTTVIEHRDPRQLLLGLAERASLVVMGSRGRGPVRTLLLGSVTSALAGHARCPVVVIPTAEDAARS